MGSSKSYLYGKTLRNAPRAAKIHFFLRYNHHDPLWWTGSLSPVLQIVGPSPLPPALCALAQLFPPQLPSSRSIFGSCLCHRGRHWTHREYPKSYSQRSASAPSWSTRLSSSRHFTDLPLALRQKELTKPTIRSRQTEGEIFPRSESSLQRYCRCRYDNAYNLWLSRRGSRGLHSQAASWSALLCAHHLQRRTKRSESGNGSESRQRSCIQRGLGLFAIHPEQTAFLHCIQPHARATGWSFLQQGDHRTPRPRTTGLCGCSQDDPTVEKKDGGCSIRTVRPRLEAAEFTYTPFHWNAEHRFVAVRRPVALETDEIQQRLFTFRRYTYHRVLVTNLELTAPAVWRFYCDRACQELLLREFKDSYAMAKIPTRSFSANAAYMEILLWAYDLVLAFQALCLPKQVQHWNISTLRRELWWLPAEWVKRGNRNYLRLPARYPQQELFRRIQSATSRVQPLI